MKEVFNKLNDYTLRIDFKQDEGSDNGVRKFNGYSRIFNFLAREVTTIHRDWLYEPRGGDAGGTSAISTHAETKSFDALASDAEVKVMHAKLVELGGTPPALEQVLPDRLGKGTARPTVGSL